jgi:SRSO17 transposase
LSGHGRQIIVAAPHQKLTLPLVSLTLAQSEVPVPVGLRLFLPQEWIGDPERCAQAGGPETAMLPRSKGEIALKRIDRLRAASVRFGTVLADAGMVRVQRFAGP